jgi:hypothetical protein
MPLCVTGLSKMPALAVLLRPKRQSSAWHFAIGAMHARPNEKAPVA